jgi:hypothetical protein
MGHHLRECWLKNDQIARLASKSMYGSPTRAADPAVTDR